MNVAPSNSPPGTMSYDGPVDLECPSDFCPGYDADTDSGRVYRHQWTAHLTNDHGLLNISAETAYCEHCGTCGEEI